MSVELVRTRTCDGPHRDKELYKLYFSSLGMSVTPMGNPTHEVLKGELPEQSLLDIYVEDIYIVDKYSKVLYATDAGLEVTIGGTNTKVVTFEDERGTESFELEINVTAILDKHGTYISWVHPTDKEYVVVGTEISYNVIMKVN